MEHHEKFCGKNSENVKKCFGCEHIEETQVEIYFDHYDGSSSEILSKCFFCKKRLQRMFPLIAERRWLPEKYPETFQDQVPMPNQCEFYEETRVPF